MLTWIIKRKLAAFEREFGYDTSYLRNLLETDRKAFFAFVKIDAMASYRRDVPVTPYYAAKLVAIVDADCGPCTQLVVAMARKAGVDGAVLAAVLRGDDAALSPDVLLAVRFARAALAHDPEADTLRDEIIVKWGARAVASLALAAASAGVYPTVKYALGFGHACSRIVVDGQPIAVVRAAPVASASA